MVVTHVLATTPTPGIWVRGGSCTLENGRNDGSVSCDGGNGGSGKLSVDACTCMINVALNVNVCGSTLCCGCVVNGSITMAAFGYSN